MHNTIKDLPYDDRPYEKCIKYGPKVLSDAELISVILKTGTRDKSSIELARQMITDSDNRTNLLYLFRKSIDELLQINGIGVSKAVTLKCISEISERIYSLSVPHDTVLNNPYDVAKLYMERMRHLTHEVFIVLFLNTA